VCVCKLLAEYHGWDLKNLRGERLRWFLLADKTGFEKLHP
jgi:hypothetical protein